MIVNTFFVFFILFYTFASPPPRRPYRPAASAGADPRHLLRGPLIDSCCRVLDRFSLEITPDQVGLFLTAEQIPTNVSKHLRHIPGSKPSRCVGFHILIQQFIRVQIGAVAGEKDQPDLIGPRLHPLLHLPRLVHRVLVHDEVELASRMPHQAAHKRTEHLLR